MSANTLRLHEADNVVVALKSVQPGDPVDHGTVIAREPISPGHKVATRRIETGQTIIKYGQIIGWATAPVDPGYHVHTHNVTVEGVMERRVTRSTSTSRVASSRTFEGYARSDGTVGTRNFVCILPTVNCSATVARMIAAAFPREALGHLKNVDGVFAPSHASGCSAAAYGAGYAVLQRTLAGLARHPNVGGVLLLGLGCEDNDVASLVSEHSLEGQSNLRVLRIQDAGGTRSAVARGTQLVAELLEQANSVARSTQSAAHLRVAVQCGGSDGFSGISANPALGAAGDRVVAEGGTVVLSETPEIFGAEHLLLNRAIDERLIEKLNARLEWWVRHAAVLGGGTLNENPSHGNKLGGLTTIFEKSLGAVAKAGTTALCDVIDYAEPLNTRGFVFMDSPGNDPVSVTGQVASGCNVVCFTTGRGSVFGGRPAPSLKLATNSDLYRRMSDDMDINCGRVIDGELTVDEMGGEIFEHILRVASGELTRSESLGFGAEEITPWQMIATL
jgi:altronate hydrolase